MSSKKIHCFRHVPFEGLGCIETWCRSKPYPIAYTNFYEADYQIPPPTDYDALIVMGGPMGTCEEDKYEWLKLEKRAIKEAIDSNKVVIGICLGSQLIANALGAEVYKNKEKEIGWWSIQFTNEGKNIAPFDTFGDEISIFQWHGDTFDLPEGAVRIASSEACLNQAFIYDKKVLGLQFHFEVDEEGIQLMSGGDLEELNQGGKYVQPIEQIKAGQGIIPANNELMFRILDTLVG